MQSNDSLWQMLLEWATLLSGVVAIVEFAKWISAIYRHPGCRAKRAQLLSNLRRCGLGVWAINAANVVMYGMILLIVSATATFFLWTFTSIFLTFLYPDQYFAEHPKAMLFTLASILVIW